MTPRIYVVSKIKHAPMWEAAKTMGYPIISSWIGDGGEDEVNFREAWPRYLGEAAHATHVIVYTEPGEELKGGLLEIGAALGAGAAVYLVGDVPGAMRTAQQHPDVFRFELVTQALAAIPASPRTDSESPLTSEDIPARPFLSGPPLVNATAEEEAQPAVLKTGHLKQTVCPYCVGVPGVSKDTIAETRDPNSKRVHQSYDDAERSFYCATPVAFKSDPHAKERVTKLLSYNNVPAGTVMRIAIKDIPKRGHSDSPSREDMEYETSEPLFGEIGRGTATFRAVPQTISTHEAGYASHVASLGLEPDLVKRASITGPDALAAYEQTYGCGPEVPEVLAALRREDVLSIYDGDQFTDDEREQALCELDEAERLGDGENHVIKLFLYGGKVLTRKEGVASLRTSDPNFKNRKEAENGFAPLQPFPEED